MTRTSRSDPRRKAGRLRPLLTAGLLLLPTGLGGCAYTVRLLSEPDGATILLPDGSKVVTPAEATFHAGRHELVVVEADGYRTVAIDMKRTEGQPLRWLEAEIAQRGGREVTFVLVKEHGPVGSAAEPGAAPPTPTR